MVTNLTLSSRLFKKMKQVGLTGVTLGLAVVAPFTTIGIIASNSDPCGLPKLFFAFPAPSEEVGGEVLEVEELLYLQIHGWKRWQDERNFALSFACPDAVGRRLEREEELESEGRCGRPSSTVDSEGGKGGNFDGLVYGTGANNRTEFDWVMTADTFSYQDVEYDDGIAEAGSVLDIETEDSDSPKS